MRTTLAILGVTLLTGVGLTLAVGDASQTSPATQEETPIRALHEAFVTAYNAADAQALSNLFADDAAVIDSAGVATRGRADIAAMYADAFKDAKGLKLDSKVESMRFLTADVAEVEGQSLVSGGGFGDAPQASKFVALLVRRDGRWKLVEIRDTPAASEDVSAYDRLKELEWMVGDWIDESGNAKVRSSVRWAVNESFLIRTYSAEVNGEPSVEGTSFIGWDPQSGQIKSWVFDSEGGHGEALWTRVAEDRWVVKMQGVTLDGRSNSSTQTQTLVSNDSVKLTLRDRIIGGELAPDVVDVLMVRQPPPAEAPGQAAPTPGASK